MAGSASSSVWVFLIFVKCCNSLPLETPTISINPSNGPDAVYVGYVSDPEERGTASLVISCVMTVFLCAWFSLHLNLPQRLDSVYNALLRTLKWIIAIVYAPEVVVFTAWTQWNSARILKDIVKAQQEKSQEGSESQKFAAGPQNEWTMAHTFFASAGGFVFEIDHSGEEKNADNFLPADCPRRLTITARGIALLARCGRLPDISKADVTDKSKVNNIASALVIMQALWILTEVIGRLAVGLPVTLLEVNTVAHLTCALIIYTIWWHKPLSPREPIILQGDWVKPLCAFMYMSSELSGEVDSSTMESQTKSKSFFAFRRPSPQASEIESMSLTRADANERVYLTDSGESDDSSFTTVTLNPTRPSLETNRSYSLGQPEDHVQNVFPGTTLRPASRICLAKLRAKKLTQDAGTPPERRPRIEGGDYNSTTASHGAINRWRLAASAIQLYPAIEEHQIFYSHYAGTCLHFKPEHLVAHDIRNWPGDDLLRNASGSVVGPIFWLACSAYGAIHLTAWNNHFPSEAEKWLWRSFSLLFLFCGGLCVISGCVSHAPRKLKAFWERWINGGQRLWLNVLIGAFVAVCGLSLVLARGFIVIESFISLRELPLEAYQAPSWTQVFPHF